MPALSELRALINKEHKEALERIDWLEAYVSRLTSTARQPSKSTNGSLEVDLFESPEPPEGGNLAIVNEALQAIDGPITSVGIANYAKAKYDVVLGTKYLATRLRRLMVSGELVRSHTSTGGTPSEYQLPPGKKRNLMDDPAF